MELSGHEGEIPIPIKNTHDTASGGPPPPLATATIVDYHHRTKKGSVVKYRECLKNHAASIGGNATDGCGEFMPGGEEGTLEALKCSACGCHRNFHRKETEGESSWGCYHPLAARNGADAFGLVPRPQPLPHMIMPPGAMQTSESDEMEGVGEEMARPILVKKRLRTKFTPEQKEKMLCFAEKIGWRLQKQEEGAVQQFCQEIGVRRRVLKVWMHNNKHHLAKKSPPQLQ
ncbi:ZF-HD protein dimerization region containing protein [Musa troglodytarum]|uniref:ZF-HD protein dimerization region containing protein n=1 Tax=Musa troglodytarum TaxID=320322 RepID=A0A9E7GIR7_9LILI|nr:ZF-HD protein dimerization region containing protein [Musa troglodytarum]